MVASVKRREMYQKICMELKILLSTANAMDIQNKTCLKIFERECTFPPRSVPKHPSTSRVLILFLISANVIYLAPVPPVSRSLLIDAKSPLSRHFSSSCFAARSTLQLRMGFCQRLLKN